MIAWIKIFTFTLQQKWLLWVKKKLALAFALAVKVVLLIAGGSDAHGFIPMLVATVIGLILLVSDTLSHTPFLVLPKS